MKTAIGIGIGLSLTSLFMFNIFKNKKKETGICSPMLEIIVNQKRGCDSK